MLPTLENGDYLVLEKSFLRELEYKRGDIVIFKADIKSSIPSERDLVKRIIATEGDHLVIMDNEIFVNDKKINENYILKKEKYQNIDIYIEKNSYFVMGDNRKISLDSRNSEIGMINKKDILGKVILKMFPFKRFRG